MRSALLSVAFVVALSGCYPDADGCLYEQCRADAAARRKVREEQDLERAREIQAAENCKRAEADPARAAPDYLHQCRAARWARSGVYCSDSRIGDRLVEVACEVPARDGAPPDFRTAYEKILQRAAYSALSAGKPYVVFAGEEPMQMKFRDSVTPVSCRQRNPGLYAAASIFAAAGSAGPAASTNCRTMGSMTTCDTTVRQPAPMPQPTYDCTGGDQTSTAVGATLRERYELIDASELAARSDPNLPPVRRPWDAHTVAATFSGLN